MWIVAGGQAMDEDGVQTAIVPGLSTGVYAPSVEVIPRAITTTV